MPRLFVAVWPPEDVLDAVAAVDRPPVTGVRWTGREQWHVTLRFLGKVAHAAPVAEALRGLGTCAGATEVEALLGPAVGRFGRRVLHVPVSGLDELAAGVAALTTGIGQVPEERLFFGHITLARVTKGAAVSLGRLVGEAVAGRWTVGEVCLVESHLSSAGARYEVVGRFPLSGSPGSPGSPGSGLSVAP